MATAKTAQARRTVSTILRRRLRREFPPREFGPAVRVLLDWDTKDDAPGEQPSRMHRAAITAARGTLAGLRGAIRLSHSDFRDLLMAGEPEQGDPIPPLTYPPEPGPPNPEEEAFLAVLAKNPADNLTRLVYADWLDERNDPRGGYLRVLVEWLTSRKQVDEELFAREEALRVGLSRAWLARIRGMPVRYKKK